MSFLIPKAPDIKPIAQPSTPTQSDADVQKAAREERDKYYSNFGGRGSALLTGGLGANPGFGSGAKLLSGGV